MKKNLNSKNHDPANQCVTCGCAMLEGDHVCIGCRTGRAIYPHGLNVRVTDAQMAAIERACIQKGLRIGEIESYSNPLVELVKQSGPAPLDIVQVLRQNGVEVEP